MVKGRISSNFPEKKNQNQDSKSLGMKTAQGSFCLVESRSRIVCRMDNKGQKTQSQPTHKKSPAGGRIQSPY